MTDDLPIDEIVRGSTDALIEAGKAAREFLSVCEKHGIDHEMILSVVVAVRKSKEQSDGVESKS